MELWRLDATDLVERLRTGQVSAQEALASCLERLRAVNPTVNAVVRVLDEEARAAAIAADDARARGEALGPLHGVPFTTKINVDQAGCPTDQGAPALKDRIAVEDSPVVDNLRRAGAIPIGRTNASTCAVRIFTDNPLHGRTRNPLDGSRTPGGSSGGAGAAVAVGIGPIAHGTDLGGSIRIPAYCCGVVGLRVGLGRIPAFNPSVPGGRPMSAQLMATQGPLTRTVRDARLALAAMACGDRRDWKWADAPLVGPPPPRPIRVALVPEVPGGATHPAQADAVRRAGRHLEAAGYAVEEIAPPSIEATVAVWHRLCATDLFGPLRTPLLRSGDTDGIAALDAWLTLHPPADLDGYIAALTERDALALRWLAFLERYPIVVLPTLADLPPVHAADTTRAGMAQVLAAMRPCLLAPVVGLPALAVPVGRVGRLRTGVQIVAGRFREDLCLDAGEAIEAAEGVVPPVDP